MQKLVSIIAPLIVLALVNAAGAGGSGSQGTAVDDWQITMEVNSKIRSDPLLKGFEISVDTRQKTVTLSGSVGTQAARDRATQLARSAKGVKRVYNLIMVSK